MSFFALPWSCAQRTRSPSTQTSRSEDRRGRGRPVAAPLSRRHVQTSTPIIGTCSNPSLVFDPMPEKDVPTLYEWLGGIEPLNRLTTRFYEHVREDDLLAPIFARMGADHPAHVAAFLAEVLGGPATYSEQHGGHAHMVRHHLDRHLTQEH